MQIILIFLIIFIILCWKKVYNEHASIEAHTRSVSVIQRQSLPQETEQA